MKGSGRFLLDTNIIILILNRDKSIRKSLAEAREVLIPIISVGELLFGAAKSTRQKENLQVVQTFALHSSVLICDFAVAQEYGEIKNSLKSLGKPIPENDIWIASIARRWNLTLVTRDQHFQVVPGLHVEAW